MLNFVLKPAKICDSEYISNIHAYCWRETYHFMPEAVLKHRNKDFRKLQWENWFVTPHPLEALFKVMAGDEIVGFCFCKENDDLDLPTARGELNAGYILPEYRGGVAGPMVILTMSKFLRELDLCPISLWAFKQNRVRLWYAQLGFKKVIARNRVIQNHAIPEFGYVHPDGDALIERLEFLISRHALS